jgi:hypothetical protein
MVIINLYTSSSFFPFQTASAHKMLDEELRKKKVTLSSELRKKFQTIRTLHHQMDVNLDEPVQDTRDKQGLTDFRCLLGDFFALDIFVWESVQFVPHDYAGMYIEFHQLRVADVTTSE